MHPVQPIDTRPLFPKLDAELLGLLEGLEAADWQRPTACAGWSVKDLTAHILDGSLRRLSFQRDRMVPPPPEHPITGHADRVAFLNRLNADWVRAARRLSPRVLIELLEVTGPEVARLVAGLDPEGEALFPVAWAGQQVSPNWFDVAREHSERWHHQQQIRDAVGAEPLLGRELFGPVLDTFVRGLPHAWRAVEAAEGAAVGLVITGEAGGSWTLLAGRRGWELLTGRAEAPAVHLEISQEAAWRLFTNGLDRETARRRVTVTGEPALARPIFGYRAVMV